MLCSVYWFKNRFFPNASYILIKEMNTWGHLWIANSKHVLWTQGDGKVENSKRLFARTLYRKSRNRKKQTLKVWPLYDANYIPLELCYLYSCLCCSRCAAVHLQETGGTNRGETIMCDTWHWCDLLFVLSSRWLRRHLADPVGRDLG